MRSVGRSKEDIRWERIADVPYSADTALPDLHLKQS